MHACNGIIVDPKPLVRCSIVPMHALSRVHMIVQWRNGRSRYRQIVSVYAFNRSPCMRQFVIDVGNKSSQLLLVDRSMMLPILFGCWMEQDGGAREYRCCVVDHLRESETRLHMSGRLQTAQNSFFPAALPDPAAPYATTRAYSSLQARAKTCMHAQLAPCRPAVGCGHGHPSPIGQAFASASNTYSQNIVRPLAIAIASSCFGGLSHLDRSLSCFGSIHSILAHVYLRVCARQLAVCLCVSPRALGMAGRRGTSASAHLFARPAGAVADTIRGGRRCGPARSTTSSYSTRGETRQAGLMTGDKDSPCARPGRREGRRHVHCPRPYGASCTSTYVRAGLVLSILLCVWSLVVPIPACPLLSMRCAPRFHRNGISMEDADLQIAMQCMHFRQRNRVLWRFFFFFEVPATVGKEPASTLHQYVYQVVCKFCE